MGRSVKILSQHNIYYSSIEELCTILANKLQLNIDYCFPSYIDLDEYLPKVELNIAETTYEKMYLLHQTISNPMWEKGLLYDVDYMYAWLYEKFGEDAGSFPQFKKHWEENSLRNNDTIKFFINGERFLEFESDKYNFDIYRESLGFGFDYNWRSFSEYLTDDTIMRGNKNQLLKSINQIKETAQLFGGTFAYYIMESSDLLKDIGELQEADLPWQEVESRILKNLDDKLVINIRKCLFDEEYRNEINKIVCDNHYDYPVYIDDFTDSPAGASL